MVRMMNVCAKRLKFLCVMQSSSCALVSWPGSLNGDPWGSARCPKSARHCLWAPSIVVEVGLLEKFPEVKNQWTDQSLVLYWLLEQSPNLIVIIAVTWCSFGAGYLQGLAQLLSQLEVLLTSATYCSWHELCREVSAFKATLWWAEGFSCCCITTSHGVCYCHTSIANLNCWRIFFKYKQLGLPY